MKDYKRIVVSGNGKRTYENLRDEDTVNNILFIKSKLRKI